ncbi:MAG: O-antigen ligase family protein [Bacteroidia bacterium]
MKKIFPYIGPAGATLFLLGLSLSRVLITAGLVLMLLHPLLNDDFATFRRQLFRNKAALLLLLLFCIILFNGIFTDNQSGFVDSVIIRLPLLFMPFALASPTYYKRKNLLFFVLVFIAGIGTAGVFTLSYFLLHYEEVMRDIQAHQPVIIIGGLNHIYYSVMLAFALLASFVLLWQKWIAQVWLRRALYLFIVLGLIFLHSLSARTGMLAFYGSLLLIVLYIAFMKKRYLTGIASVAALGGMLLLAFWFVKPFQARVQQSMQDISVFVKGEDINQYSISMRLAAWEVSGRLFLEHPVFGTGIADLRTEMEDGFDTYYPALAPNSRHLPHNQFLIFLAGAGLTGFLVFVGVYFFPLFLRHTSHNFLFLTLWLVLFFALMAEAMLERQVGVSFFAFFWILLSGSPLKNEAVKI